MASVRDTLNLFLDKAAGWSFEYGQHDCMLEVADWLDYSCKLGAAEPWRGTYSSQEELDALMPEGLEAAMSAEAARLGLVEAATPQFGDVGLLTLPEQEKPVGGILMPSGKWRIRTQGALIATRTVTIIVAWVLPCRPLPPPHS